MAGQTLSITQMYALARSAGLAAPNAAVAAAIGMAESTGRTAVTSANPDGGVNVGIWQLDTRGVGSGYTVAELSDPSTNAKVMAKGSDNGTDWSDWATYVGGQYTSYLGQAQAAESAESSGGSDWVTSALKDVEGIAGDLLNPLGLVTGAVSQLIQLPSQVTDFLTALEAPVKALMWLVNPANWVRIIAGFLGVLLAGFGLYALAKAA
jgi:Lysozyme like domain